MATIRKVLEEDEGVKASFFSLRGARASDAFLLGFGMVVDLGGVRVIYRSPRRDPLTAIGQDFNRVGEYLRFALSKERGELQKPPSEVAEQLYLDLVGL